MNIPPKLPYIIAVSLYLRKPHYLLLAKSYRIKKAVNAPVRAYSLLSLTNNVIFTSSFPAAAPPVCLVRPAGLHRPVECPPV